MLESALITVEEEWRGLVSKSSTTFDTLDTIALSNLMQNNDLQLVPRVCNAMFPHFEGTIRNSPYEVSCAIQTLICEIFYNRSIKEAYVGYQLISSIFIIIVMSKYFDKNQSKSIINFLHCNLEVMSLTVETSSLFSR